jgi:hypothetical protein
MKRGLKATFASDTEAALVPELQDTEHAVVQAFENALTAPMDPAAKTLVAGNLEVLKATHERLTALARQSAHA